MQQKLIINRLYSVVCLLSSVLCLRSSTSVKDSLQIGPFMQNKPNFKKAKMNVNLYFIEDYRKNDDFVVRINKPNSNPISSKAKINANAFSQKDYENETARMIISFGGSPSSCAGLELVDAESSRKCFVVLD